MAALVAARITALRPGASPPPVAMPIQRMSDIGYCGGSSFVIGPICITSSRNIDESRTYDHTVSTCGGNVTDGRVLEDLRIIFGNYYLVLPRWLRIINLASNSPKIIELE